MTAETLNDPTGPVELPKTLRSRHLAMIAIGGIIGAGLFVSSSAAIAATGPAIIFSYMIAGVVILSVMRMLAEMVAAKSHTRIFTDCIHDGLGAAAGFVAGWLYWLGWMVTIAVEAIIAAKLLEPIAPVPVWISGLVIIGSMVATNLWSTRAFAEFEFLLSSIKVGAIIVFLLLGIGFLMGMTPNAGSTDLALANLTQHGGFAPFGPSSVLVGVITVVFSMLGAEIATVAAAEAKEGARAVSRMASALVVRVILFYVGSVAVIMAVVPWTAVKVGVSPFLTALETMQIPGASLAMTVVLLIAVLSCLNSGLYANSRVLFVLAGRGDAPKWLVALNKRQAPARSIILAGAFGYVGVLVSVLSPEVVFAFLVNSVGAMTFVIYLMLCASHIRQRRQAEREGRELPVKMWLFPWLTYATIAAIVGILVLMAFSSHHAKEVYGTGGTLAVLIVAALLRHRARARAAAAA